MPNYHPRYRSFRKKKPRFHRVILYTLIFMLIAAIIVGYVLYRVIFHPNVWLNNRESCSIYIPSGSSFEEVKTILYSEGIIINRDYFEWLAKRKKYPENIKPGHYLIKNGTGNDKLINLLRSGNQTPVKVTFNNIRTLEQLASRVSKVLELDSSQLVALMNDTSYLKTLGISHITKGTIFIPNTYEFYWNTDAHNFIIRMKKEFEAFWNESRRKKADSVGLSISEVVTLASIIERETSIRAEKPIIAGVYLNRLRKGWLLQADPTVVFATGNFNIRRVLNDHKQIDSPYNTYKYGGLPPGPICFPSISSIDAVLNPNKNDYMYFCAREDLSGYHNFAKTAQQHYQNAARYQNALNKMKIYN